MKSKKLLRQEIKLRKRQFTRKQLDELSFSVIQRLNENRKFKEAKIIMLYYSLPDEVNTHELIDSIAREGKKVVLPVVIDDENMELREYNNENDLKVGAFNILEPIGKRFEQYDNIDVAVIPGMSFDKKGNRLGRGKGYYDRFLPKIKNAYTIGICFDFQKEDCIPVDVFDRKVDEVI